MNSFKYSCKCSESRSRIPIIRGIHVYEPSSATAKLDKALDQLVDSAWDDGDQEADEMLVSFLGNLKKGNYVHLEADLSDILKENFAPLDSNAITSSLQGYPDQNCHCREVMHRVSIVLNWGLAELHCNKEPNEHRLLEVLRQLEPFAGMCAKDKAWNSFLQQLWNFSVDSEKVQLSAKLFSVYPDAIDKALENLLSSATTDVDTLLDNSDFNSMVTLITIPEVFKHISLQLARQDSVCLAKAQMLLNALLKALKSNVSKSRFLALYPETIRSVAAILYEAINPDDPLLTTLLEQIKRDNFLEFIILVTHFPVFLHLK